MKMLIYKFVGTNREFGEYLEFAKQAAKLADEQFKKIEMGEYKCQMKAKNY